MNDEAEYFRHVHDAELNDAPFHYRRCGLDNVYLLNGFEIEHDEDGERYVTVIDVDTLHKAIGLHLVCNRKQFSGKELRFLRREMDLTQSEVGRLIGQNSQQVARWEKGESKIPGPADRLIRLMYLSSFDGECEDALAFLDELDSLDDLNGDNIAFSKKDDKWLETTN